MWLLTSLNRPKECQEALDAFAGHGSTPGVLWLDGDDYPGIRLPKNWLIHRQKGGLAEAFRWFFKTYPNLPWYGWLADDMRPATRDFDLELIKATEGKYFVYCNGGKHKTPSIKPPKDKPPLTIPGAMVWAGDLVRAVGWWTPPWTTQTCMDESWKQLCFKCGAARYVHEVVVHHLHWMSGLRPEDATDKWGMSRAQHDVEYIKEWMKSDDFKDTVEKIKRFTA